ncbi:DMT family transporter [Staphylococcus ratti]|uniref:DMT family transporter n=1 Tax=Staphylococcus ratti TaxID=2892440 RepID=A0ABY3PC55_9STAP|nr:DMT family transporter [Staphylococcus ratti]UEX89856.1 DMT family transporter [Staphylococcus ratti]
MIVILILLTLVAGAVIPLQTSINARLSQFTHSSFYASTLSFFVGTCTLAIIILLIAPHYFTLHTWQQFQFDYHWLIGGLMGVIFLTGNLILLPRIGASLTVVTTLSGQLLMSVMIDTFGWFHIPIQPLNIYKAIGVVILAVGIGFMNYHTSSKSSQGQRPKPLWLMTGVLFGFAPPIQTAINSSLGQMTHSPLFAALISFSVGTLTLFIITCVFHRRFSIVNNHEKFGALRWWYFIGGALGALFVTTNIIVAPLLGITLTLIIIMLGQIIMGLCIDHFGWMGIPKQTIQRNRILGLICIVIAIIIIQFN